MFISDGSVQVRVEVNFVFRGTVLPIEMRAPAAGAQEIFTTGVEVPMLQAPELYGSKLDAQTIDCFVAYLVGHNRPVHEVLFPNPKDLAAAYKADFVGMTQESVPLETLARTQADLDRLRTRSRSKFEAQRAELNARLDGA